MRLWPVTGAAVSVAVMAAWATGLAGKPVHAPRLAAPRASTTAPALNCDRVMKPTSCFFMLSKTPEGLAGALPEDYKRVMSGIRDQGSGSRDQGLCYCGNLIVKVDPRFGWLSTVTVPPCASTEARTRLRPRPRPRVVRLWSPR